MGSIAVACGAASLKIGGIEAVVRCEDEPFLGLVRDRYEGFLISTPEAPATAYDIDVTIEDELLPGSEVTPTVEDLRDGYRIHRRDFFVTFDFGHRAVIGGVARSMFSFDSMLRIVYTLLLLEHDGMLIHGSSIVDGGEAFLFYGVSGSGKTTTTLLSASRTVLSDELTLVRKIDGRYRAFGTPFWGELRKNGENIDAPLRRAFLLRKDARVFLEEQTPACALRGLLPCVLFFAREPRLVDRVATTAIDFVESIPSAALHFRMDDSFWAIVRHEETQASKQ